MERFKLTYETIDPEIVQIVDDFHRDEKSILDIFQSLQAQHGGLTDDMVHDVARALKIPDERAFGVASFYAMISMPPTEKTTIRVCDGPPCWLRGSKDLSKDLDNLGLEGWRIERTSCLGLCDRAPAALVGLDQCGPLTKASLQALPKGWQGEPRNYAKPLPGEARVLLANIGEVDPYSIESALRFGAYTGLKKALFGSPGQVIDEVEQAGVRGRGGAGFPAGRKWRYVHNEPRFPKYVVCNADESEPLVFKDRVCIETNPHQILEGMALAGFAVGAEEGFIYIRGEYEPQALILENAIQEAESLGYLGSHLMDSNFSFKIHIHRGAGAYICGEESALLESLEGRRGEPRVRPPYPTVNGYLGFPTVVNNVETLAAVPQIIRNGADWYLSIGNPASPGTKIYTILGHINRPGLFEAPYGLTLQQIIDDFGGGMSPGSEFQFALTGGAAGTIVPPALLDLPIDYDTTTKGIALGAGAILVCDQSVNPVELLRELLFFFEVESCGKCTPCRIGTRIAREVLDRMASRDIRERDFDTLQNLAEILERDSFCGLGQFAAMPMKSMMANFERAFH